MAFQERLNLIYKEQIKEVEYRKAEEKKRGYVNSTSGKTLSSGMYHFFAVADYILQHDIGSFKKNLSEAVDCRLHVFEQYDAGKIDYPFDGSEVSVTAYMDLLEGLASGDMEVTMALAHRVGGREEIESRSNDFARSFCYTLKHCILGEDEAMAERLSVFAQVCLEKDYLPFQGYADIFTAILNEDVALANEGVAKIASSHTKLAKSHSWFAETEDELLSVWGIGMANLARHRGLAVEAIPPFIPDDLLIDV